MQRSRPRPKFSITPVMDFSSKIREIVDRVSCPRHDKRPGQPCWWIHSDSNGLHRGICASRVGQVYDGQISASSLNRRNASSSNRDRNATRYPKKEFTR